MDDLPGQSSERSAHAIYGLIIVTSALVADRELALDAASSLAVVWGAGVVLLLAHLYAATLAAVGARGRLLTHAQRHLLIADNVPVLAAVVLPTSLIGLAGLGAIDLGVAIDLSIAGAGVALFAVGLRQAQAAGLSRAGQIGLGVLGVLMGVVVIVLEVGLSH